MWRRSARPAAAAAALALAAAGPAGAQTSAISSLSQDLASSAQAHVPDGFTLALAGDLILTHPVSALRDPGLQATFGWLRGADAAFGNLEETLFDVRSFKGHPQFTADSLRPTGAPAVAKDLKAMGFGLVSRANNHTTDWGPHGMRSTDRLLDAAGIVHAGSGADRAQARAPAYLETPKGRISLVSVTTTFEPGQDALPAAGEAPGRPGSSAVRTTRKVLVSPQTLVALRQVSSELPKGAAEPAPPQGPLMLFGTLYDQGTPGLTYSVNAQDRAELLAAVRQGKLNSDLLILNIHSHEPGNWSDPPADFLPALAHAAIDAGADVVVCEGPHHLRGVEVYKGRPVFYSLGNYLFTMASAEPVAADIRERLAGQAEPDAEFNESRVGVHIADPDWHRSVVASVVWRDDRPALILLHPIELALAARMADRGLPHAATGAEAEAILKRLAALSQPFGTRIEIRDGVGVIRLASDR